MLDRWSHRDVPVSPPPPVPALAPSPVSSFSLYFNSEPIRVADRFAAMNLAAFGTEFEPDLNAFKLPAPW